MSDGAALVLLARRSAAERLRLPIQGTLRSFAAVGVEPAIMGVGPAAAIPVAGTYSLLCGTRVTEALLDSGFC